LPFSATINFSSLSFANLSLLFICTAKICYKQWLNHQSYWNHTSLRNTAITLRITRDISETSDILTMGQKQLHANNCLII